MEIKENPTRDLASDVSRLSTRGQHLCSLCSRSGLSTQSKFEAAWSSQDCLRCQPSGKRKGSVHPQPRLSHLFLGQRAHLVVSFTEDPWLKSADLLVGVTSWVLLCAPCSVMDSVTRLSKRKCRTLNVNFT